MKPASVKDNTYIQYMYNKHIHIIHIHINNTYNKLKVGDYVKISNYKNIFAKVYTPT